MGVKAAKFGGSSVADGIQIRKTKDIIKSDKDRRYIVVSAPGKRFDEDSKITDLLYLCKAHKDHNVPYDQVFQVIYDRFIAMELDLKLNVGLDEKLNEIKKNIEEGAPKDYIASRGEFLNAIVMAEYLGYDFVDTKDLLVFDDKGVFLSEESNKNLKKELKKHDNAVFPGFYGSLKKDGRIKTFSRGGSDITGAIVAKAADADIYENWTDVSGFLMADPRIVKDAKPISTISYMELRELSYMGASVLHESAIAPARDENIPINIRNTNRPQDPGTIIAAEVESKIDSVVTGIAGKKDFVVIAISKNNLSSEVGFIRKLLTVLEDFNIRIEHLPTGIDTVSLIIAKKYLEDNLDEVISEMKNLTKAD